MDRWELFRNNIKFIRKHFKITQEFISDAIGCSRAAYQHAESKGNGAQLPELIDFWYKNYGITPNDLLLEPIDNQSIKKIERRIAFERLNKRTIVKVKKSRP